jgi:hypothetical protein
VTRETGAPKGTGPKALTDKLSRNEANTAARHSSTSPCPECGGSHWVRVDAPHRYVRPCGTCPEMSERYELWRDGHFDTGHRTCGRCEKYNNPWRWRSRRQAAARAGRARSRTRQARLAESNAEALHDLTCLLRDVLVSTSSLNQNGTTGRGDA